MQVSKNYINSNSIFVNFDKSAKLLPGFKNVRSEIQNAHFSIQYSSVFLSQQHSDNC